jgi:hypothetical protein
MTDICGPLQSELLTIKVQEIVFDLLHIFRQERNNEFPFFFFTFFNLLFMHIGSIVHLFVRSFVRLSPCQSTVCFR